MRSYTASYEYDGRAWLVQFDDPDISTFGATLRSAKRYARDLLRAYLEVGDLASAGAEVVDRVVLPSTVRADVEGLASLRRHADTLRRDVASETRRAARELRQAGFSLRDVGEILGVSPARVAQIEREGPGA